MNLKQPQIIEGDRVYVVEPFPLKEAHRIYSWMKAFKTVIQTDYSPKTKTEFVQQFKEAQAYSRTWAVIDKNNELVGAIIFEPQGQTNGFMHVASRISAFGSRIIDEAGEIVIEELFNTIPTLTRLSAVLHAKNNMAASLAKRVGFVKEGRIEDMIVQKGEPKAVLWFGFTRKNWIQRQNQIQNQENEICHSQPQPDLLSDSPEDFLEAPLESLESKADKTNLVLVA